MNNKFTSKLGLKLLGCIALSLIISVFCYYILFYASLIFAEKVIAGFHYIPDPQYVLKPSLLVKYQLFINRIRIICIIASFILFIFSFLLMLDSKLQYIREISEILSLIQSGKSSERIPLKGNDELNFLAENINTMMDRISEHRNKEETLQTQNKQIIMELAHDIRTPLTSVMSYIEFIKKGNCTEEQEQQYLDIAYNKSEQIKQLTDKLFEKCKDDLNYSDSSNFEIVDSKVLLLQILFDVQEYLSENGYNVDIKNNITSPTYIKIDISELNRVIDNLISNILKYADKNDKIIWETKIQDNFILISQKNTIYKYSNAETSGIGLKNIKSIIESFSGKISVKKTEDLFLIEIFLPIQQI